MSGKSDARAWKEVLEFWFPEESASDLDADAHREHWLWRMRGGADTEIIARFSDLTAEAARGNLDHWASNAEGRLALIIVLDQFSRSLWRGGADAFAQDRAALVLVMDGLRNGHYAALTTPWLKIVFGLPLGHCEGRDHLERLDLLIRLREHIATQAPAELQPIYLSLVTQAHAVRKVIATFGRHPHRNQALGRQSTPAEQAYLAEGRFPHLRAFED
jgi:uncharacterized protein (DUF924 family)